MCVHALFIKIARVFTICGGDVAPFISIISAKEFARAEAVAPLLICQLNVTENTRGGGGGGSVDLAQVFSPLPPNASVHPTTAHCRIESLEENIVLIISNLCVRKSRR